MNLQDYNKIDLEKYKKYKKYTDIKNNKPFNDEEYFKIEDENIHLIKIDKTYPLYKTNIDVNDYYKQNHINELYHIKMFGMNNNLIKNEYN